MDLPLYVDLVVCGLVFLFLAIVAVALRFRARQIQGIGYGTDDYAVLAALLVLIITIVIVITSPDSLEGFSERVYVGFILNELCLGLIKVSLIQLYKRIFFTRKFTIAANIVLGVVVLWLLAGILASIFSAWPIDQFWLQDNPNEGMTMNYGSFLAAFTAVDILLDVVLLSLPLPMIKGLQISMRRKFYLAGIFWLGIFCVAAGAVRVYYGYVLALAYDNPADADFAYVAVQNCLWGDIEPCFSIVAACLPCYGPLVKSARLLGSTEYSGRHPASFRHKSRASAGSRLVFSGSHRDSLPSITQALVPGNESHRSWHRHTDVRGGEESIQALQLQPVRSGHLDTPTAKGFTVQEKMDVETGQEGCDTNGTIGKVM